MFPENCCNRCRNTFHTQHDVWGSAELAGPLLAKINTLQPCNACHCCGLHGNTCVAHSVCTVCAPRLNSSSNIVTFRSYRIFTQQYKTDQLFEKLQASSIKIHHHHPATGENVFSCFRPLNNKLYTVCHIQI
jgi:hypothetical protein